MCSALPLDYKMQVVRNKMQEARRKMQDLRMIGKAVLTKQLYLLKIITAIFYWI